MNLPDLDSLYLHLIEEGRMTQASALVERAAREAGFEIRAFHGTPDGRFLENERVFKNRWGGQGVHWFADDRGVAASYADDVRAFDYQNADPAVFEGFLRLENPLIVEGGGGYWRDVQKRGKTSDVIEEALEKGYDGVIIRSVIDFYDSDPSPSAGKTQKNRKGNRSVKDRETTTYAVFQSEQIKSAAVVVHDDQGRVIRLSDRFCRVERSADIRFCRSPLNHLKTREIPSPTVSAGDQPMDLHIVIKDENGETLRHVNIWQDGSDREGADEIADWILENYDGAKESEKPTVLLSYLYRDGGNYKNHLDLALTNRENLSIEEIERRFRATLRDGDSFVAEQVSLPTCYSEFEIDPEIDHGFHEYKGVSLIEPDSEKGKNASGFGDVSDILDGFELAAKSGWKLDDKRWSDLAEAGDSSLDDGFDLDEDVRSSGPSP